MLWFRRDATGAVLTGRHCAGIELELAMASHELGWTHARIVGYTVDAVGIVLAKVGLAVVLVDFTALT